MAGIRGINRLVVCDPFDPGSLADHSCNPELWVSSLAQGELSTQKTPHKILLRVSGTWVHAWSGDWKLALAPDP